MDPRRLLFVGLAAVSAALLLAAGWRAWDVSRLGGALAWETARQEALGRLEASAEDMRAGRGGSDLEERLADALGVLARDAEGGDPGRAWRLLQVEALLADVRGVSGAGREMALGDLIRVLEEARSEAVRSGKGVLERQAARMGEAALLAVLGGGLGLLLAGAGGLAARRASARARASAASASAEAARLGAALGGMREGVAIWRDDVLVAWNPFYEALFPGLAGWLRAGLRRDAIESRIAGVGGPSWATVMEAWLRHRRGGGDGEFAWSAGGREIESYARRLPGGDVLSVHRDVSERRAAQALLQDALDRAPVGMLLCDADDRVRLWNAAYLSVFPFLEGALRPGMAFEEVIAHGARRGWVGFPEEIGAALARRLAIHRACEGELIQEFADGRVARIRERRTRDGGIVVVVEDLTEERAAARRLAASEARFEDFARASSDWFWETDAEGRFSYLSEQVLAYGFTPQSRVGLSRLDLLRSGGNDPALIEAHAADVAARRPFRRFRYRMRHPGDAREMWLEVDGTPVFSDGVFTGYRGVAREVTAQVAVEEALRAAKEEAERASESKSRFLATISHEIRTPLNGVVGLLDLLAEDPLPAEAMRRLEAARTAAGQLGALVGDVLDLSRIDEGAVELERLPTDVEALCVEVARTFAASAAAKGIEVAVAAEPEARGMFLADPTRLRQIVSNLVGNAVKFTDEGGVSIRLSAGVRGLEIAVRDSGPGIPEEARGRLFRRFSQADASTTRAHGGTGLGLAISADLAALFGGGVSLESEVGRGSVFRVSLPLERVPGERPAGRTASGLRILLVDDVALNREILADQVRALGGTVRACASGEEALEAVAQERFDVGLIDRCIPGMDGVALARALAGRIPALVLCTSLGRRDPAEAPPEGLFRTVLLKPCRTEALAQAIAGGTALAAAAEPAAAEGDRILVAEDNDVNWEVLSGLLGRLGRRAVRARNGAEAVEMAQAEAFGLILMDVQMPVMDGVEAVRRIRAGGPSASARILAATANVFREDIDRYLASGFDGHLAKPVSRATLARVLGAEAAGPARPAVPAGDPAVDGRVLSALVADLDAETVREAADVFFGRFGAAALADLEARGQAAVAASAHGIKGAAGQLGLAAVAAAAADLEGLAKEGRAAPADCARLVAALASAETAFPEALRAAAAA